MVVTLRCGSRYCRPPDSCRVAQAAGTSPDAIYAKQGVQNAANHRRQPGEADPCNRRAGITLVREYVHGYSTRQNEVQRRQRGSFGWCENTTHCGDAPRLQQLASPRRARFTSVPISANLDAMASIVSITNLHKTYASGFQALKGVNLEIRRGEIFALLGPNGAGKTTLINIVCGIVNLSSGSVRADGHDVVSEPRAARSKIGLVPQELVTAGFETVWATATFSRGLFGKKPNSEYVAGVLRSLSLWDKKDSKIMTLSGGMKRRVMIAKALSHEPEILFLDEPTAGVDVELRLAMWDVVRSLRDRGVTVILTTHYIEEAEEMADRVGVMSQGELILVEEKIELMRKLGRKQLTLHLQNTLDRIPSALAFLPLALSANGRDLVFTYDAQHERNGIASLLEQLQAAGIKFSDLQTSQSSLEDIFVSLVRRPQ